MGNGFSFHAVRVTHDNWQEAALWQGPKGADPEIKISSSFSPSILGQRPKLGAANAKFMAVEEKFILDQIDPGTYKRWHSDLSAQVQHCKMIIEKVEREENQYHLLCTENFEALCNNPELYQAAAVEMQQELLNTVFGRQLYYKEGIYRTIYIKEMSTHNALELRKLPTFVY